MQISSDSLLLNNLKFGDLVRDVADNYQRNLPLRFFDRVNMTPADDDEITGTFTGIVYAAPLVADDAVAPVVEAGQLELVTNTIPNIKLGRRFGQRMLHRLNLLRQNGTTSGGMKAELSMFEQYESQTALALVQGINEQINALVCAMLIDTLTYSGLGIKFTGSWGMPNDLKFNAASVWVSGGTPQAGATPITDILTAKQFAETKYGEIYDRITMSRSDFNAMVATTEFKQLIQGITMEPLATTAFNPLDPRLMSYANMLLNATIELEDKNVNIMGADGAASATRVLPLGKVLFTNSSDDKSQSGYDFGNAITTESIIAPLVQSPSNSIGGNQFGPIGYYTGKADMNPPNLTAWGVCRGFPRRFRKSCSAVLTVR